MTSLLFDKERDMSQERQQQHDVRVMIALSSLERKRRLRTGRMCAGPRLDGGIIGRRDEKVKSIVYFVDRIR